MERCKTCKRWKDSNEFVAVSDFGHVCDFEPGDDESNWTYLVIPASFEHHIVFMPGPDYGCVHHEAKGKS